MNSSYRNQLQQLTATFNLSTSTTDSSTDGGRVFGRRRKGERGERSSSFVCFDTVFVFAGMLGDYCCVE